MHYRVAILGFPKSRQLPRYPGVWYVEVEIHSPQKILELIKSDDSLHAAIIYTGVWELWKKHVENWKGLNKLPAYHCPAYPRGDNTIEKVYEIDNGIAGFLKVVTS